MSRNYQPRASARASTKSHKYASTSEESSDSDAYNGVDDITDDDEDGDEPDVERVERQYIRDTGLEPTELNATPRPSIDDAESWDGISSDDQVLDDDNQFDEHMARSTGIEYEDGLDPLNIDFTSADQVIKHVRFADDSDDSDIQSVDSQFPDILDRDSLNPNFLQQIEHDSDDDANSDGSYWDHHGEDETPRPAQFVDEEDEDDEYDSDSSSDLSGYDSDSTTEDLDITRAVKASQVQKIPDAANVDASSSEEEVVRTVPPRPVRAARGPRMGTWIHSLKRPFAIIHTDGKKMILFNQQASRRSSVDGIVRDDSQAQTLRQNIVDNSPMMSNSANIMMSAASSNDFYAAGPEAYFPWTSVDADGTIHQDAYHDSSSYDGDDLDDGEGDILLEDFLNFDEDTSHDEKENEEEDQTSDATAEPASTPGRPTTAEDKNHQLLNHFSNVNVGAFRRDQDRMQLLNRNMESKESLAFGQKSYLEGTLRGVKSGRLQHATAPITPVRRRKVPKPAPYPSSPASPLLAKAEVNKKRRYEGEDFKGHKRNRSLV